jgi:hypothetical protein
LLLFCYASFFNLFSQGSETKSSVAESESEKQARRSAHSCGLAGSYTMSDASELLCIIPHDIAADGADMSLSEQFEQLERKFEDIGSACDWAVEISSCAPKTSRSLSSLADKTRVHIVLHSCANSSRAALVPALLDGVLGHYKRALVVGDNLRMPRFHASRLLDLLTCGFVPELAPLILQLPRDPDHEAYIRRHSQRWSGPLARSVHAGAGMVDRNSGQGEEKKKKKKKKKKKIFSSSFSSSSPSSSALLDGAVVDACFLRWLLSPVLLEVNRRVASATTAFAQAGLQPQNDDPKNHTLSPSLRSLLALSAVSGFDVCAMGRFFWEASYRGAPPTDREEGFFFHPCARLAVPGVGWLKLEQQNLAPGRAYANESLPTTTQMSGEPTKRVIPAWVFEKSVQDAIRDEFPNWNVSGSRSLVASQLTGQIGHAHLALREQTSFGASLAGEAAFQNGRFIQCGSSLDAALASPPITTATTPSTVRLPQAQAQAQEEEEADSRPTKVYAIYFPQYHSDALNSALWGANYTDWTGLAKAPLHNRLAQQILRPLDKKDGGLGRYDLLDTGVRKEQGQLAAMHGVDGFIFHHYWFHRRPDVLLDGLKATDFLTDIEMEQAAKQESYAAVGARLDRYTHENSVLAAPLLRMLEDGQPDIPFALNWCNEPWIATWHGTLTNRTSSTMPQSTRSKKKHANEPPTLQEQWFPPPLSPQILAHYRFLSRFFHHPNYIKVDGKPLFFVYKDIIRKNGGGAAKRNLLDSGRFQGILKRLNHLARKDGFPGLHLVRPASDASVRHVSTVKRYWKTG